MTLTPEADARVLAIGPDSPDGNTAFLSIYREGGNFQNTLIRFDLSGISSLTPITSATLTLQASYDLWPTGNPSGLAMDVYRASKPWIENEVTWNSTSGGTLWTNPGGDYLGTTGFPDVSLYASNGTVVTAPYTTVNLTWDVTSLVREWVDGTSSNDGLVITSFLGNGLHFVSREGSAMGHGLSPSLTINAVPEPTQTASVVGAGIVVAALSRRLCRRSKA